MSESEETEWRLRSTEPKQDDKVSSSLEAQNREDLQERVQAKAEAIGGGSRGGEEGSLITKPEEEIPATEDTKQRGRTMKKSLKARAATRKKESNNNLATISKRLEKQSDQLARIEKLIQPLQKSFNKIDKQSNTIKKLYTIVTQLQRRQTHPRHFQQEQKQKQKQKSNRKKRART
jgi:hypothetical protein